MGVPARLRVVGRACERREVQIDGTVRHANAPVDVTITDLSETGFGAVLDNLSLEAGTLVAIGTQSIGVREARVIWSNGNRHGFEFAVPLRNSDVMEAKATDNNIVSIPLAPSCDPIFDPPYPEPVVTKWPGWMRIVLLLGTCLAAWIAIIMLV